MCGIVGFFSKRKNKRQILKKQLRTIAYRGPDDEGFYENVHFGMGHNRLAIIDVNNARQPMKSSDGRYILAYNGEIYNYLELRQHLLYKGYDFSTYSDTEVLLNMYIHYGKECLPKLNGMFAFAIYDTVEKTVFLARDHFGIKPLYYTTRNDEFIFASEIKAILEFPQVKAEPDLDSINEYLTLQLMLKKHTLFKNIYSLEPASYLVVKNGTIVEKDIYWDIKYEIDESKTKERYSDEVLIMLEHSSYMQMRSDVPVGSFLSGGIDSSIVATMASKNFYGNFCTFTGAFRESKEYDETYYADIMSRTIGSTHFELYPNAKDFIDTFENIVYHLDYPEAGPGVFSQYMVSRLASEHVKVVLGGQGGDEIFGGYTRYAVAYLEQALKGAIFETQEEGNHLVTLQSIIPNMPQLKSYLPMMQEQFKEGLFGEMDERYFNLINRAKYLNKTCTQEFLSSMNQEALLDKFKQVFNAPKSPSYFNKMTYFDLKTLLPALLHVEDRVSMAHSLESRVPLLDYRIVELAAKMPPNMKFAGGRTKAMLIDSVKNILPLEIINRKDKMGFPTPLNLWLGGELKEYALDILTSQKARQRGIFDTRALESQMVNGGKFGRDIWGALNLEVWYRKFID